MTAENEGRDGYDGGDGYDGDGYDGGDRGGVDALMAAITGEPLPDEARADAAFMAEHRSATADVALLRERLVVIGDALAAPTPAPAPVPARPVRGRRTLRFAYGGLAVAAAASVVAGLGWLAAHGGAGLDAAGSGDAAESQADGRTAFGSPDYLACARVVAEGDVTAAESLGDPGLMRVGVHVKIYYKADELPPTEVTYVVDASVVGDIAEGDRVLFGVPEGATTPDHWTVGKAEVAVERALLKTSLAESRGLTCP